jgi:hypothetical protein
MVERAATADGGSIALKGMMEVYLLSVALQGKFR